MINSSIISDRNCDYGQHRQTIVGFSQVNFPSLSIVEEEVSLLTAESENKAALVNSESEPLFA